MTMMISIDDEHTHLYQQAITSLPSLFINKFTSNYKREFGFELKNRKILVDDVRIRAVGGSKSLEDRNETKRVLEAMTVPPPKSSEMIDIYFAYDDIMNCHHYTASDSDSSETGRKISSPVYVMNELVSGQQIEGPALIIMDITTVVVDPGCTAIVTQSHDIEINIIGRVNSFIHTCSGLTEAAYRVTDCVKYTAGKSSHQLSTTVADPIYLSIFCHRFMGIAEQMGKKICSSLITLIGNQRLTCSASITLT
jgi:5-oxoprolinase (ATP-hydrolysing)